jgi:hypothetical protein
MCTFCFIVMYLVSLFSSYLIVLYVCICLMFVFVLHVCFLFCISYCVATQLQLINLNLKINERKASHTLAPI